MSQINHMPWDDGAIADVFCGLVTHKTTKTQCGKRVLTSTADHKSPTTCPSCLAEMERREFGRKQVEEYMRVMQADGFDAANALFSKAGAR